MDQQMDKNQNTRKKTKEKTADTVHTWKTFIPDAVTVLILIIFDQLTKWFAVKTLGNGQNIVLIPGVLELTFVKNRGAAFGILQNAQILFFLITAAAFIAIGFVLLRLPAQNRFLPVRICLLMILAGAAGNFIDRVYLSYVRDFIYFSLIDFPVFNVADIYITCATFAMVLLMMFYYRDEDDFSFLSLS